MKMNMIIGKKQIILAALVLALGAAVYLNWTFSNNGGDLKLTGAAEGDKNYGDSQFVSELKDEEDGESYFAEAKLSRQRSRDEAVETLAEMLQDANLDTATKAELALKATELAKSIETEGKIENLIKAKGFQDCMVYYDTEKVDVIVKSEGLLLNEVAQMKDIILEETSIPAENIKIIETK